MDVCASSHCPSQPVVAVPGRSVQVKVVLPKICIPIPSMIAIPMKAATKPMMVEVSAPRCALVLVDVRIASTKRVRFEILLIEFASTSYYLGKCPMLTECL